MGSSHSDCPRKQKGGNSKEGRPVKSENGCKHKESRIRIEEGNGMSTRLRKFLFPGSQHPALLPTDYRNFTRSISANNFGRANILEVFAIEILKKLDKDKKMKLRVAVVGGSLSNDQNLWIVLGVVA